MDATMHSTQLMGQHASLPTPLTPVHTSPIKIVTEDQMKDTENSTPNTDVLDNQVSFLCCIHKTNLGVFDDTVLLRSYEF